MHFLPILLEASSGTSASGNSTMAMLATIAPFAIMLIALYFIMLRPQRKKEKNVAKMREALQVGDEITTIGGISGRVVSIKDDSIVVESSADRSKIQIKKWAIQSCDTVHDA